MVESQTRKADTSLWQPELKKLERRLRRQLKQLTQQVFACQSDAFEALMQFQDCLEVHQLTGVSLQTLRSPGRPPKSPKSSFIRGYRLQATLERTDSCEGIFCRQRSRFILTTNQLDTSLWPAHQLLTEYKRQQTVERGFRFGSSDLAV